MEKIKRILALTGALLLVALYACTLIFALMDSPAASRLLAASVAATILIPVLLYGYILIARLLKERGSEDDFQTNNISASFMAVTGIILVSAPLSSCRFIACLFFRYSSIVIMSLAFPSLF